MSNNKQNTDRTALLRIIFLVLGIVFVVIGLLGGEHAAVMNKAVRICLECIGIG